MTTAATKENVQSNTISDRYLIPYACLSFFGGSEDDNSIGEAVTIYCTFNKILQMFIAHIIEIF